MLAGTHPAFDGPVILFQNVIKVLHRSMSTFLFQNTVGFELNDGWRISSVLVAVDNPRREMVLPAQGLVCSAVVVAWPWWLAIAMHSCGIRVFRRPSFDPAALRL